jgi:hypothetical protein
MTPHFCKQLGRNAKKVKMQNKVEVGHKNDWNFYKISLFSTENHNQFAPKQ